LPPTAGAAPGVGNWLSLLHKEELLENLRAAAGIMLNARRHPCHGQPGLCGQCCTVIGMGLDEQRGLSPRRHVGDRPARGVEADRRADGVGDALHDDLLVAVGEVRVLLAPIAANEGVGQLVSLDPDLGVGGELRRDRFNADVLACGAQYPRAEPGISSTATV
jgi:hypothetical protein